MSGLHYRLAVQHCGSVFRLFQDGAADGPDAGIVAAVQPGLEGLDDHLALLDRRLSEPDAGDATHIVFQGLLGSVPDDAAIGHGQPEGAYLPGLWAIRRGGRASCGTGHEAAPLQFFHDAPLLAGRGTAQGVPADDHGQELPVSRIVHAEPALGHVDHADDLAHIVTSLFTNYYGVLF